MNLKILLPERVFALHHGVSQIIVETPSGSYGLLPHRLDCIAVLTPSLLRYTFASPEPVYVALGDGVLVKVGADVTVAVRRAIGGGPLQTLRDRIELESARERAEEDALRAVMTGLEVGLMRRLVGLHLD